VPPRWGEGFGLAGRGGGERRESGDEGNEGDQSEGGDAETLGALGEEGGAYSRQQQFQRLRWNNDLRQEAGTAANLPCG